MTPLGATLTLLLALTVLLAPRRWAALGVMAAVCYITQGQQFIVLGFHFTAIRIVLLVGTLRLLLRGEFKNLKLNKIDWALIAFTSAVTVIDCFRVGTSDELVYRLGCAYDILLSYWVFRGLLTAWDEVEQFLRGLAVLIVPFAMEMILELFTQRNLFQGLGGVGELTMRNDRPRSEGAFRHGITAGVFGATLMPLFVGLFYNVRRRGIAMVGLASATVITYTSNSSGPLMAFFSGLIGLLFWRWRKEMKVVRWGIIALLVGLHLSMKAPVWYIFSKMSSLTGGDGWYRSELIDQFIRHFSEWWLMGTSNTRGWMPTQIVFANGEVGSDITNQYVSAGLAGGLLALFLFVLILVRCFHNLGIAMKEVGEHSAEKEKLLWCMGAALFAHVVTLFTVTYFDQMHVAWWALVAMISSATSSVLGQGLTVRMEEQPIAEELAFIKELPQPAEAATVVASQHHLQEFE